MTWHTNGATALDSDRLETEALVRSKFSGRLKEFALHERDGTWVLVGRACSYHVKQLALHEVMQLTDRPIGNHIRVIHPA